MAFLSDTTFRLTLFQDFNFPFSPIFVGVGSSPCTRRAAAATKNAPLEDALHWAINHANDPDFNLPMVRRAKPKTNRGSSAKVRFFSFCKRMKKFFWVR